METRALHSGRSQARGPTKEQVKTTPTEKFPRRSPTEQELVKERKSDFPGHREEEHWDGPKANVFEGLPYSRL